MTQHENGLPNLRKRAEDAMRELPVDLDNLSPDAIQTLVHELQVHQIELELQNEELRRIQDELQDAHKKYTYLYDYAPVGYFTLNPAGVIEEVNLAGAALLGMDKGQLIHRSFSELVDQEDQDTYYLNLRRFFGSPSSLSADLRLVRQDGTLFYAHLMGLIAPDDDTQRLHTLLIVTDITEQKRNEQRALQLSATYERERLARDLHDAVSQSLFAALIIAEALPRVWEQSPERAKASLIQLQQLNRGALAEMRTLLLDLRPEAVLETEFGTLLEQLAAALQSQRKVAVSMEIPPHLDLSPQVKLTFYRITQEALNNVAKYARSHHVTIRLIQEQDRIELSIRDDGKGFDPKNVSTGFGLRIMRERAEAIGASLHIASQVKQGTTVTLVWPVPSS